MTCLPPRLFMSWAGRAGAWHKPSASYSRSLRNASVYGQMCVASRIEGPAAASELGSEECSARAPLAGEVAARLELPEALVRKRIAFWARPTLLGFRTGASLAHAGSAPAHRSWFRSPRAHPRPAGVSLRARVQVSSAATAGRCSSRGAEGLAGVRRFRGSGVAVGAGCAAEVAKGVLREVSAGVFDVLESQSSVEGALCPRQPSRRPLPPRGTRFRPLPGQPLASTGGLLGADVCSVAPGRFMGPPATTQRLHGIPRLHA